MERFYFSLIKVNCQHKSIFTFKYLFRHCHIKETHLTSQLTNENIHFLFILKKENNKKRKWPQFCTFFFRFYVNKQSKIVLF